MSSTLHLPRPRPSTTTEQRGPDSTGRDPWFDNAKMLLVTLVVIGHAWVLLPADSLARTWSYDFLYLWHMPAFVMVTGYLSRSFAWSRRHLTRLVTTVAVPYLMFEALMAAFRVQVGGEDGIDRLFLEPHWPMWFLAALFLWRLATPLLRACPAPVLVAVAVSLLGGLLAGDVVDVGRVTGMLPFFVLGLTARREHLDLLRSDAARRVGAAVLAAGLLLAHRIDDLLATEWLYWRSGYAALGVSVTEGMLVRLALIAAATVLALSALALVPRSTTWFTPLGAASMVVYLFHGFFIKAADYIDAFGWTAALPWAGLLVTSAAAAGLAVVLAAPPVADRLNHAVDPVGALRRRRASRARATAPAGGGTGYGRPDHAGSR